MRQLEPCHAPPRVGPQQVGVDQLRQRRVGEPQRGPWRAQYLRAQPVRRHQVAPDPPAQRSLGGLARARRGRDLRVVVAGQRLVDVAEAGDVRGRDLPRVGGQRRPQSAAHHLQLDRLDVRPLQRLDRAVDPLHPHLAQVVDQLLRRLGAKRHPGRQRGRLHGRQRGCPIEQVEAEGRPQLARDRRAVRVEPGDEVLAHRHHQPHPVVAQRLAELGEERLPRRDRRRLDRQQLLELVEHQHLRVLALALTTAREVLRQRQPGERRQLELPRLRHILLEAQQRAQHISVHARRRARRRLEPDAHDRPDRKARRLQPRDQPGLQQRALAGPRRRVEQHDALGEHPVVQPRHLAVAAVQRLARAERPRPDVGVSSGAHPPLPPGSRPFSSRRKSSAVPQKIVMSEPSKYCSRYLRVRTGSTACASSGSICAATWV